MAEPDARDWLLFHAAQGLFSGPKEGFMLLWEGGGSNGKTAFLRAVTECLGPYADKFNVQLLCGRREEADRPNSAAMVFKRCNYLYCEETDQGQVMSVARMKELSTLGNVSATSFNRLVLITGQVPTFMIGRDRVAVIGAGMAGLIAARELQRRGIDVVVLESASRPGGRMLAETTALGSRVDLGGQWIGHGHHRFEALAAELGTAREVISRQLGEFQRRGWIRQSRGSVELVEPDGLERLAALDAA